MYNQSPQTSQEEENKARDKDFAKPRWWSKHCSTTGRRTRPSLKDSKPHNRIRSQRRLQGPLPPFH